MIIQDTSTIAKRIEEFGTSLEVVKTGDSITVTVSTETDGSQVLFDKTAKDGQALKAFFQAFADAIPVEKKVRRKRARNVEDKLKVIE